MSFSFNKNAKSIFYDTFFNVSKLQPSYVIFQHSDYIQEKGLYQIYKKNECGKGNLLYRNAFN